MNLLELTSRRAQLSERMLRMSDSQKLMDECATLLSEFDSAVLRSDQVAASDSLLRLEIVLSRAEKSIQSADRYTRKLVIYLVVWGAILVLICAVRYAVVKNPIGPEFDLPVWIPPLMAFIVGAFGGVTAALYGLYTHVVKRDFDEEYILWYYLKPVMGLLMGPLAFLVIRAGILATSAEPKSEEILILASFMAGFSERFSVRMIDRISAIIFGTPQDTTPTTPPGRPKVQTTGLSQPPVKPAPEEKLYEEESKGTVLPHEGEDV